jgi:hypothetical protein
LHPEVEAFERRILLANFLVAPTRATLDLAALGHRYLIRPEAAIDRALSLPLAHRAIHPQATAFILPGAPDQTVEPAFTLKEHRAAHHNEAGGTV